MDATAASSTAEMLPNIEAKRLGKLLSGEEIINCKNNSLKDLPSGCKDYSPDNSWLEQKQIQATLETYHNLIGAERIEKKQNLSSAVWISDVGKAKVTKKAGKHWEVFGHAINSDDWLYPEEALFLLEVNALELYADEVPLSLEQTYTLVIGEHCSLGEYRVYSHLSRKGYRVLRHDKRITVTRYERDVHLDQMSLVERRRGTAVDKQITDTARSPNYDALDVASKGTGRENLETSDNLSASTAKEQESSASLEKTPGPDDNKRKALRDPSPELMIIDDPDVEVINIDHDDDDVEITFVKTSSQVETVDLLESDDEDDDVVFVPQKAKNDDPSKWRKWYLTVREFVTMESPQERSTTPKMSKLKMIDYFDLAKKDIDSIMRAIPPHNGSVEFINAPDQRFIPVEILPKYAHYKISLHTEDVVAIDDDASRVDTTQNLEDIVRNDQPQRSYGYSFHRTRTFSYTRPYNQRPFGNWTNRMYVSEQSDQIFADDSSNNQQPFFQRPQRFTPRIQHQNQNNFGRFGQNSYQNNFQSPFFRNLQTMVHQQNRPQHQMATALNNMQASMGQMLQQANMGQMFQQAPNPMAHEMKMAVQQACQMQLLAMSLMQSSQTLIQLGNSQGSQLNGASIYRHRRPYHRGNWRGRGGNWMRQPQQEARNSPKRPADGDQNVVSLVDLDDEDSKEKPKLKRVIALSAIANMNSPKRMKTEFKSKVEEDIKPTSTVELKTKKTPKFEHEKLKPKEENDDLDDDEKHSADVISLSGSDECEVVSTATPTVQLPPLRSSVEDVNDSSMSSDILEITQSTDRNLKETERGESQNEDQQIVEIDSSTPEIVEAGDRMDMSPEVVQTMSPEDGQRADAEQRVSSEFKKRTSLDSEQRTSPDSKERASSNAEKSLSSEAIEAPRESKKASSDASCRDEVNPQGDSLSQDGSLSRDGLNLENHPHLEDHPDNSAEEVHDESVVESWDALKRIEPAPASKSFRSILNYDEQRIGVADVLKSLQVIGPIDETVVASDDSLKVVYDVYLPNQPFRKSLQLVPNYRIVVSDSNAFPSVVELKNLRSAYKDDVPFVFAVVYDDSVSFYNLQTIDLPTLIDDL